MLMPDLPDLQPLTVQDRRLRQVATDPGRVREAIALAENALADARARGDGDVVARLLAWLGEARRVLGEPEAGEAHIREALELSRAAENPRGIAGNLIRLGEALRCQDRFAEAEAALREALATMDEDVAEVYRDFALQHLGKTLLDAGRVQEAREVLREALAIRERKGIASLIASTREALDAAGAGLR